MKIWTKEIIERMPELYANEEKKAEDTKITLKLFCCDYTAYVTEASAVLPDGSYVALKNLPEGCDLETLTGVEDVIMLGYVRWMENELGYISWRELSETRWTPLKFRIERDMHFGFEHTLAECQAKQI